VLREGKSTYAVGRVLKVDFSGKTKRIKFGFPRVLADEWIEFESNRIFPLYSKVPKRLKSSKSSGDRASEMLSLPSERVNRKLVSTNHLAAKAASTTFETARTTIFPGESSDLCSSVFAASAKLQNAHDNDSEARNVKQSRKNSCSQPVLAGELKSRKRPKKYGSESVSGTKRAECIGSLARALSVEAKSVTPIEDAQPGLGIRVTSYPSTIAASSEGHTLSGSSATSPDVQGWNQVASSETQGWNQGKHAALLEEAKHTMNHTDALFAIQTLKDLAMLPPCSHAAAQGWKPNQFGQQGGVTKQMTDVNQSQMPIWSPEFFSNGSTHGSFKNGCNQTSNMIAETAAQGHSRSDFSQGGDPQRRFLLQTGSNSDVGERAYQGWQKRCEEERNHQNDSNGPEALPTQSGSNTEGCFDRLLMLATLSDRLETQPKPEDLQNRAETYPVQQPSDTLPSVAPIDCQFVQRTSFGCSERAPPQTLQVQQRQGQPGDDHQLQQHLKTLREHLLHHARLRPYNSHQNESQPRQPHQNRHAVRQQGQSQQILVSEPQQWPENLLQGQSQLQHPSPPLMFPPFFPPVPFPTVPFGMVPTMPQSWQVDVPQQTRAYLEANELCRNFPYVP
jgi:hypothetical protein